MVMLMVMQQPQQQAAVVEGVKDDIVKLVEIKGDDDGGGGGVDDDDDDDDDFDDNNNMIHAGDLEVCAPWLLHTSTNSTSLLRQALPPLPPLTLCCTTWPSLSCRAAVRVMRRLSSFWRAAATCRSAHPTHTFTGLTPVLATRTAYPLCLFLSAAPSSTGCACASAVPTSAGFLAAGVG
jgi:hypothetical protein